MQCQTLNLTVGTANQLIQMAVSRSVDALHGDTELYLFNIFDILLTHSRLHRAYYSLLLTNTNVFVWIVYPNKITKLSISENLI